MGTVYGVVLNDRSEIEARQAEFAAPPHGGPPKAPVLYIKPRNTWAADGSAVALPSGLPEVEIAATLALTFGTDPATPVAAALAIDISEPHASVYRPAIRQRCRDRFLPIGALGVWSASLAQAEIATAIDGREAHRWSLSRLVRSPLALAGELAAFMTLAPGDVLLVGLPFQPPRARAGQAVRVTTAGLPPLSIDLVSEEAE